jgi:signal transduction histidine kinase
VEADEPEVLGDRRALRSMVRSLLAHSLKHGSDGGSIDVDLRRNASFMQLTVREAEPQPPGARPAEADSFRRGSAATARNFGGLGVGLMKTQRLVELHGGSVWAESEGAGRGARLVISLPLASEE